MNTIRVLVVDDSAFMRKIISDILNKHPKIEVIDVARNGKEAVEKTIRLKPDVITLDIEMPIMDGLEALDHIMKEVPTPVVMLSSMAKASSDSTMVAIEKGAVDFVAKPGGSISLNLAEIEHILIDKVIEASKVQVSRLVRSERS
ncbi:MAG TPA: response regulator, partial [Savagea sp.]